MQDVANFADSIGLKSTVPGSNPVLSAKKTVVETLESSIFGKDFIVANTRGRYATKEARISRKTLASNSGYPYRKARAAQSNGKWYIIFYVWDLNKRELVRKRVAKNELNDCHPDQRVAIARKLCDDLNYLLQHDATIESESPKVVNHVSLRNITVIDAINFAQNHKRVVEGIKENTLRDYVTVRTTVEEFYAYTKTTDAPIAVTYKLRDVNEAWILRYFTYLKTERKIENKTYNNRKAMLHATCEVIRKQDPNVFHKNVNPFASVNMLKTQTKKHAAYTDDQMKKFAAAMIKGKEPHVLLFMQFIFYTLARPEELRLLQVGHIRLEERRILFLSQNAKTSIEQYVFINDRFAEIIAASGIMDYPHDYFVFSSRGTKCKTRVNQHPGPMQLSESYFYKRVLRYITSLGFRKINPNYTLYSFKHSGAISLYKATRDIKLLQEQCRHQNLDQTNTYLRDLGLFSDMDRLNKWNGPL